MTHLLEAPAQKIKSLSEISDCLEADRKKGLKIVQCHGVFDLLHPGHIRHFREAKAKGDKLVVTVTPDRFVNKGPSRPVFTESLRLESIAAIQDVDYVVLNDSTDAVSAIKKIHPSVYVKGEEYNDHAADITGKISEEANAVHSIGGEIYYTNDIVFSSSSLLNQFFENRSPEVSRFLNGIKQQFSAEEIIQKIEGLKNLKVLIVGDAIIDEYQYSEPLGQSGKGLHMVARCQGKDVFLGGSLIIANHVSQFTPNVTLLTAIGRNCPYLNFIKQNLDPTVKPYFVHFESEATLIKKRYVLKEGNTLSKLFETYSENNFLSEGQTNTVIEFLQEKSNEFDLIIACDFGNGFTNPQIIDAISDTSAFLALNTQINSGNRGFNVVTNYRRADYISLNEPELRLSAHNKLGSLEGIAADICQIMNCQMLTVTRGVQGIQFFSDEEAVTIPAFSTNSVDRIGAGDSYLSLSSLCVAKGYPAIVSGFIGSVAAAMSVQMVGNQEAIKKIALCKFLTRLMK